MYARHNTHPMYATTANCQEIVARNNQLREVSRVAGVHFSLPFGRKLLLLCLLFTTSARAKSFQQKIKRASPCLSDDDLDCSLFAVPKNGCT
jgi:hypothetical protein